MAIYKGDKLIAGNNGGGTAGVGTLSAPITINPDMWTDLSEPTSRFNFICSINQSDITKDDPADFIFDEASQPEAIKYGVAMVGTTYDGYCTIKSITKPSINLTGTLIIYKEA